MIQHAKPISVLLISVLSCRCATTQDGIQIDGQPNVIISCSYLDTQQSSLTSTVQCLIQNLGGTPAKLKFIHASLEDPSGEIDPIEVGTVKQAEVLDAIVGVLVVIIILGIIVAIVVGSKGAPIDFPRFRSDPPDTPPVSPKKSDKLAIADTIEIPAHNAASLLFLARHGIQRPKFFAIRIGDAQQERIEVPIRSPVKQSDR